MKRQKYIQKIKNIASKESSNTGHQSKELYQWANSCLLLLCHKNISFTAEEWISQTLTRTLIRPVELTQNQLIDLRYIDKSFKMMSIRVSGGSRSGIDAPSRNYAPRYHLFNDTLKYILQIEERRIKGRDLRKITRLINRFKNNKHQKNRQHTHR